MQKRVGVPLSMEGKVYQLRLSCEFMFKYLKIERPINADDCDDVAEYWACSGHVSTIA
jgi:hypothetical protein